MSLQSDKKHLNHIPGANKRTHRFPLKVNKNEKKLPAFIFLHEHKVSRADKLMWAAQGVSL